MAQGGIEGVSAPTEGQVAKSHATMDEILAGSVGRDALSQGMSLAMKTIAADPSLDVPADSIARSAALAQAYDAASQGRPSLGAGEIARFIVADTQMTRYAHEAMGMDPGTRDAFVSREVVAAKRPVWADGMAPSSLERLDGADLSWYSTGDHRMMSENGLRTLEAAHDVGLASRDSLVAHAVYAAAVREGLAPDGIGPDRGLDLLDGNRIDPFRAHAGPTASRDEIALGSRIELSANPRMDQAREDGRRVAMAMMRATHLDPSDRAGLEEARGQTGMHWYPFDEKLAGYRAARSYLEEKGIARGDEADLLMTRFAVKEEGLGRSPTAYDLTRSVAMSVRAGELLDEPDRFNSSRSPAATMIRDDGGSKYLAFADNETLRDLRDGRDPQVAAMGGLLRKEIERSGHSSGLYIGEMAMEIDRQKAILKEARDHVPAPERRSGLFAQIRGVAAEVKDRVMPKGRVEAEPQQVMRRDVGRGGR